MRPRVTNCKGSARIGLFVRVTRPRVTNCKGSAEKGCGNPRPYNVFYRPARLAVTIFINMEDRLEAIRDQAAWDAYWAVHEPSTTAPAVDFQTKTVIVVNLVRGACNRVEIIKVENKADELIIHYTLYDLLPPNAGCIALAVEHFHIIKITRNDNEP